MNRLRVRSPRPAPVAPGPRNPSFREPPYADFPFAVRKASEVAQAASRQRLVPVQRPGGHLTKDHPGRAEGE